MVLQQRELDGLGTWLGKTELLIAGSSEPGPTLGDLEAQLLSHMDLQEELKREQANISGGVIDIS